MATCKDILEQLSTAVAVVEATRADAFDIAYLNQAGQALFGCSQSQAVGAPLASLLPDDHAAPAKLHEVLATGQPFTKREVSVEKASSRVNYSISPLSATELLLEFTEIDRFNRINQGERHVQLQDTVRKLARGLAHEVKNPLGGIRGAAQLLHHELVDAELREYTAVIMAEADRLRNLVDGVLGPNGKPALAPVNVHHVIERVVRLLEAECGRVKFERAYDPSVPEIHGDFELLVQATLNVLRNAVLAVEQVAAPVIELRTHVLRQFTIGPTRHRLVACVDFVDNGPGVPADIADTLFFPMISGRANGAGLGLAITQTILAQHRGIVECDCAPGRTTFSFLLPIGRDTNDHGADGGISPSASASRKGDCRT